ncbi:MAG: hypothetical protein ACTSYB_17955 [Candidatus Helarchaeota archaeon]
MKDLKDRIAEISQSLQRLLDPSIYPMVQEAVKMKDKSKLVKICRKVNISPIYLGIVVSLLLSVSPEQGKWPLPEL